MTLAIQEINQQIDTMLEGDHSKLDEFKAVQLFVYRNISYIYDWHNWGPAIYLTSASEVWKRKKEDCDGQAILAVSILRSRGFKTAELAGNILHLWVTVDGEELMEFSHKQLQENEMLDTGAVGVRIWNSHAVFEDFEVNGPGIKLSGAAVSPAGKLAITWGYLKS